MPQSPGGAYSVGASQLPSIIWVALPHPGHLPSAAVLLVSMTLPTVPLPAGLGTACLGAFRPPPQAV